MAANYSTEIIEIVFKGRLVQRFFFFSKLSQLTKIWQLKDLSIGCYKTDWL